MWFCDINDTRLHSVSDFFAMLQYSFTRITIASDSNMNFSE